MARVRVSRVAERIKQEMSEILQRELKDPRIGFVTVTGVDVTNDLSQATIYLSVLGGDEQKEATLAALGKARGFIRTEIGRRIQLRHVPELTFRFDSSIEYGSRIERLLDELNREQETQHDGK